MERKHFQYRVEAVVLITKAELAHIMVVGASHYDGKCKQFAATTVKYWHDWCGKLPEDAPPEAVKEIALKWDEMDTVAKILEQEHYHSEKTGIKLAAKWFAIFREVRDESERVNAHHMMNDTETFTESYRAELKAKHGDGTAVIPQSTAGK